MNVKQILDAIIIKLTAETVTPLLKFAEPGISDDCAKNRSEITKHNKGVVKDDRSALAETQNVSQVERKNRCTKTELNH